MIALFTDFGTRDAYVAQLKGAILGINPDTPLIDLNHHVGQFNLRQAAYLLAASARYFPAGTIFVAVVDPGVGTSRRPILVQTRAGKFYVGPDNGIFTQVLEREGLQEAYELRHATYFLGSVSATFHGRDIFGPVAAHLTRGVPPAQFGPPIEAVVRLPFTPPCVVGRTVTGEIIHLDHFGNIITNITRQVLAPLPYGQSITLTIKGQTHTLPFLQTYGAGTPHQLICVLNSNDEFEIALVQGRAAEHVDAPVGERVVLTL
jgi:S-adenosylmethionine hydrolase